MSRFDDNQDAFRIEAAANGLAQVIGHPFLELRPPGQDVDGADKMAEAGDSPVFRIICHMDGAEKRQQMVLAHRMEADVADDDQAIALGRNGSLPLVIGIFPEPRKKFPKSLSDAVRRLFHAQSLEIQSQGL